jgi:endonuclease/exonuclease/phosphatase family metal-dependent hydrolase
MSLTMMQATDSHSLRVTMPWRTLWLGCLAAWQVAAPLAGHAAETLRVMSFNIWVGGDAGKQPLSQTMEVVRAAKADIIGLQETGGYKKAGDSAAPDNGRKLAQMLGWHYFDQGERTGVLSRFPIVTNTPRKWGVTIRLPSGREVRMFNAHLMHAPYQPYQLVGIPYANGRFIKTASEAVDEARKARGAQVERMLSELKPALAGNQPVFLTGDFNEPSHQDWTKRAAEAGKCPIAVEYPSVLAVTSSGMRDAFRTAHPDEVARPGWTWTPTTKPDDPKDRHDRIDFAFVAGPGVTVKDCAVVGEDRQFADIVVQPYPSDHRAVVATVEFP